MKTRLDLELTFDGPLSVGSGALGGSLADKPLIRDARGQPVIPGSTLKGRLRHEVECLAPVLLPDARPPCSSPVAEHMCQGDQEPCPVCRLFGSPWHPGRLIFGDLELVAPKFDGPPPGQLRYGVGIARRRRVAEDQLLYSTEVIAPGVPLTFKGAISGNVDEADLDLLRAGLESLFALGGAKTAGLGWFDLDVTVETEAPAAPATAAASPAPTGASEGWREVVVCLQSPLLLGGESNEAYYRTTRSYIPGSVLRGAVAQAALATCAHDSDEPHAGCAYGRLFGTLAAPVFEHLYPTTRSAREFPLPAPLTARSCKYHPGFKSTEREDEERHGVGDVLIRQTVYEQMLHSALPAPYRPCCPEGECHANVEPFDGFMTVADSGRLDSIAVPVRRTSRTAIDRRRGVAADGQLYTIELIEPSDADGHQTTFRGRVRAEPEQLALLERWLPEVTAIGSSRTRGLGRVAVQVQTPSETVDPFLPLEERLATFNQAVRQEWDFYRRLAEALGRSDVEPLPQDTTFFSLDLLSPAILSWQGMPVTAPPPAMLGLQGQVALVRAFADYAPVGGWHMGARLPRRKQTSVVMGSVFLYQCRGQAEQVWLDGLRDLEANGIGSDRARGYGRVLICRPFHYQAEVQL